MYICILDRIENSEEENQYYSEAIKKYGGIPIFINEDNVDKLNMCKGIVITGGFNKGNLDDYLISYSISKNIPLLGICQGMQSMALYNNDNNILQNVNNHYECNHLIRIDESRLKKIIGKSEILVNSYHHQQVLNSKEFKVIARSSDGVIEALEGRDNVFQIGVEWHPERMMDDDSSKRLFSNFINSCKYN